MKFSSIIFGTVLYLTSAGYPSRMGSFLLQLIQVRFPNRWSVFISIEQGQSHGTGGGWPAAAGPALARRRFTAAAGRARNARGAAGCDRREGDEGREGPPGPGAAPLPLLPPSLPPARALSAARRLGEPSCAGLDSAILLGWFRFCLL